MSFTSCSLARQVTLNMTFLDTAQQQVPPTDQLPLQPGSNSGKLTVPGHVILGALTPAGRTSVEEAA